MRALALLALLATIAGCSRFGKTGDEQASRYKIRGLPAGGDLDGDGAEEIVGFTRDGLTRFDGKTGRPVWTVPTPFVGRDYGAIYDLFIARGKTFLVFANGVGDLDAKGAIAHFWPTTSDRVAWTCLVDRTLWVRQLDRVDFAVDLDSGVRRDATRPASCDLMTRDVGKPWREAPSVWFDQRSAGVRYTSKYGGTGASVRLGIRDPGTPEIHVVAEGPGGSERFHTVLDRGTTTPPNQLDVIGGVVHVHVNYAHYGIDLATGRLLYKITTGGIDWRATATRLFVLRLLRYGRTETEVYDSRTGAPVPPSVD